MAEAEQSQQGVIFISYRRADAGWAADLLASKLRADFGKTRIFLDNHDIAAGDLYEAVLDEQLRSATVLIALVGHSWLDAHDQFGRRRLDQPADWVRREIGSALKRKGKCRVIPVLLDDASLPVKEALPSDLRTLLKRQLLRLRQESSEEDMKVLIDNLETIGFTRVSVAESTGVREYSDDDVNDVAVRLRSLRERQRSEFVARREFLPELDLLFNRKTFRFESLRGCPEQRWGDRLDSGYQTLALLKSCARNVQEIVPDRYAVYRDLMMEIEKYCMQMGTLLFEEIVDYNRIKDHIGKPTFTALLPKALKFPAPDADKRPIIPDEINNAIEPHRQHAVELMDQLTSA